MFVIKRHFCKSVGVGNTMKTAQSQNLTDGQINTCSQMNNGYNYVGQKHHSSICDQVWNFSPHHGKKCLKQNGKIFFIPFLLCWSSISKYTAFLSTPFWAVELSWWPFFSSLKMKKKLRKNGFLLHIIVI